MEYETVKEMYTSLRGGLSLEGRRYLLLERDVDMYVTGSNSRRWRGDLHISRGGQISFMYFFLSFGAYLMGKG